MKLHLEPPAGRNQITGYGAGYIAINAVRHTSHLLITPEQVSPWPVAGFDTLVEEHFAGLVALGPEILILGTGTVQRFPPPVLLRPLLEARVGMEAMDSGAACRTYNILMGEGRKVLAAILLA